MSLARLALRLAAVEALCPYEVTTAGPWPTIAAALVYDSRIDLIQSDEQLDQLENKPLLIVYTEEDNSDPYGSAKYPADEQVVHLVVEALIAAKGSVVIDSGDDSPPQTFGAVTAHISNREHEGLLDLLESQVRRSIDTRNMAAGSAILNKVAMEIRHVDSVPQRSADHTVWMAARTIKFHIKLKKEKWPQLASSVPVPSLPPIAWLPDPLAAVAAALDPASAGAQLCLMLAKQMAQLRVEDASPIGSVSVISAVDGLTDKPEVVVVPLGPQPRAAY